MTIEGIQDIGVFGVLNADGMEEIWAAIVPAPGLDQAAMVRSAIAKLADRAPQRIVSVNAIPRTQMMKVKRAELRDAVLAAATEPGI